MVEAVNPAQEMLGFDRLKKIVEGGPLSTAEAMIAHLINQVFTFIDEAEQNDDLTIVVMQISD